MKNVFCIVLALFVFSVCLTACGQAPTSPAESLPQDVSTTSTTEETTTTKTVETVEKSTTAKTDETIEKSSTTKTDETIDKSTTTKTDKTTEQSTTTKTDKTTEKSTTTKMDKTTEQSTTVSLTTTATTRYEPSANELLATEKAEEIATLYATVTPKSIWDELIKEYGFRKNEATYAIYHAQIDWNKYALISVRHYMIAYEEFNLAKNEVEKLLQDQMYPEDVIKYALENTDQQFSMDVYEKTYPSVVGIYKHEYIENGSSWYTVFEFEEGGTVYYTDWIALDNYTGTYKVEGTWEQIRDIVFFYLPGKDFRDEGLNFVFDYSSGECTVKDYGILYGYNQYKKID